MTDLSTRIPPWLLYLEELLATKRAVCAIADKFKKPIPDPKMPIYEGMIFPNPLAGIPVTGWPPILLDFGKD